MALYALPPQAPPVQAQVGSILPPVLDALVKAKDWPGVADWFDRASPRERGTHYEVWLTALNRARRWERLVGVCEALQPQLEAKSGPRLATYRLYRAQALTQLGRHREAMEAHAQNADLGYPDGFENACASARAIPDWKALEAQADRWIAKAPGQAAALAQKGEALARQERFQEAEPLLREALAKDPKLMWAWCNLARGLNERKAWAEALEACDRALREDPSAWEVHYNRGRALFELKRHAESREAFQAALTAHPGDPVLEENLRQARRYAGAGKGPRAAR